MSDVYQIYEVTDAKRLGFKTSLSIPSPEEIAEYMASHGILNRDELLRLQKDINTRLKDAESGLVSRLISLIYYWAKDQIKISPETLFKIMANFDKIKGFMPNEFWKKVVDIIDKIGETLYDQAREKSG